MTKTSIKISLKRFLQISLLTFAIFSNVSMALAQTAGDATKSTSTATDATAKAANREGYASFDLNQLKAKDQGQSYFCVKKDNKGVCIPDSKSSNPLASFILQIINFVTITAGSLSFLAVVVGGFMIMSSAGDENQVNKGKGILTSALIGLVITLSAYFIVAFVQSLLFETVK